MSEGKTLAEYGITNAYTKDEVDALIPEFPKVVSAFINDMGYLTEHQDISGKQDLLTEAQQAAVDSGISASKVNEYNNIEASVVNKADKSTTLAGYGITDTYTKDDIENMFQTLKDVIDDAEYD